MQIQRATTADANELAATYRSAYAENSDLGFPAKAASATAEEVGGWIRDDWVFVACEPRTVTEGGETNSVVTATENETNSVTETDDRRNDESSSTASSGDGGRVIGGVRLQPSDEERVKLSRLAVHEDHKGRGVGGRLLDRAERTVRDRGYQVVWLTTPARHPFLPDWYARRGYRAIEPYPLPYREYDEIVMERRVRTDSGPGHSHETHYSR